MTKILCNCLTFASDHHLQSFLSSLGDSKSNWHSTWKICANKVQGRIWRHIQFREANLLYHLITPTLAEKPPSFLLTDIKIGTSFQEAHDLISKQVILCPDLLCGSDFSSYKPNTPILNPSSTSV